MAGAGKRPSEGVCRQAGRRTGRMAGRGVMGVGGMAGRSFGWPWAGRKPAGERADGPVGGRHPVLMAGWGGRPAVRQQGEAQPGTLRGSSWWAGRGCPRAPAADCSSSSRMLPGRLDFFPDASTSSHFLGRSHMTSSRTLRVLPRTLRVLPRTLRVLPRTL